MFFVVLLSMRSADTGVYTASMLAYQEIKSCILMGEVPAGIRLREEKLAERIGVSRTPVREALLRLHTEQFLERHHEGGYRIAVPSARIIRELYEVRRALELFALRRTVDDIGDRDMEMLEQLEEEWVALGAEVPSCDPEFVLLDEDFHGRLAESSGNQQLAEELRRVNERIRPIRTHDFLTPGRVEVTIEEHLGVVSAVKFGKTSKAEELLERHIRQSQAVVEASSFKAFERMLTVGIDEAGSIW